MFLRESSTILAQQICGWPQEITLAWFSLLLVLTVLFVFVIQLEKGRETCMYKNRMMYLQKCWSVNLMGFNSRHDHPNHRTERSNCVVLGQDHKTSYLVPSGQDLDVLYSMVCVIKPFQEITKTLSGEKRVTCSVVKPLLNQWEYFRHHSYPRSQREDCSRSQKSLFNNIQYSITHIWNKIIGYV